MKRRLAKKNLKQEVKQGFKDDSGISSWLTNPAHDGHIRSQDELKKIYRRIEREKS